MLKCICETGEKKASGRKSKTGRNEWRERDSKM